MDRERLEAERLREKLRARRAALSPAAHTDDDRMGQRDPGPALSVHSTPFPILPNVQLRPRVDQQDNQCEENAGSKPMLIKEWHQDWRLFQQ